MIYKATSPSGKVYVGFTSKSLEDRRKMHARYARERRRTQFHKALLKYGPENFSWTVLKEGVQDKTEALKLEAEFISEYKSNDPVYGYNMTSGGRGAIGYKHTDETKLRMQITVLRKKSAYNASARTKLAFIEKVMKPFAYIPVSRRPLCVDRDLINLICRVRKNIDLKKRRSLNNRKKQKAKYKQLLANQLLAHN